MDFGAQNALISPPFLVKSTQIHNKSDGSSKLFFMPDAQGQEEELAKCTFRHLRGTPNPGLEKITGFSNFDRI
jgi:hypothetical protein